MHSLFLLINFAVFAGLLYYFLRRPIRHFWRSRRGAIANAIAEANAAHNKALSLKESADKRLAGIEGEIEDLRRRLIGEGRYKKDAIIDAAKSSADKMVRETRLVIEGEMKKAAIQLKKFAVQRAVGLAKERLAKELGAEAKARLLADAQREIGSGI
jgi:F-type H+-transporting ATPase subunit b